MNVDYIDLFALHTAKPDVLTDDLLKLIEDWKRQKVIRAFGVAGVSNEFADWISESKYFDYVMMTYNYVEARRNPIIDKLYRAGIGVLAGGSLNRSMNTLKKFPKNRNELWYLIRALAHYRADLNRSQRFNFVKSGEGFTPQQVSIAYVLKNASVTSASFNTLSTEHLKNNVLAVDMKLPEEIVEIIESIE